MMEGARATLQPGSQAPGATETEPLLHQSHREVWATVLPPFLVSRMVLIALTVVVATIWDRAPLDVWDRWDARWYVGIAAHGYHWGIAGKPALAFYPLFPLLIRSLSWTELPSLAAAVIIANAAFCGALLYLYRLASESRGPEAAGRSVWLLCLLPTAFFFFAPYTESLFLLCALGALYNARHGRDVRAGLWTAAALLTRPTGILLVPVIVVCLASRSPFRLSVRGKGRRISLFIAALVPSVAVMVGYLWYLAAQHVPLARLLTAQRAWHRGLTYPWVGFTSSLDWLGRHASSNIPWAIENLLQLSITVALLVLTVVAWRELDISEQIYCAGFWLLVLISPEWQDAYYAPFSSMDRFALALFPLWIWVAAKLPHARSRTVLTASRVLMLGAATVHLVGGWVG